MDDAAAAFRKELHKTVTKMHRPGLTRTLVLSRPVFILFRDVTLHYYFFLNPFF